MMGELISYNLAYGKKKSSTKCIYWFEKVHRVFFIERFLFIYIPIVSLSRATVASALVSTALFRACVLQIERSACCVV